MELNLNNTLVGVNSTVLSGDFTLTAWANLDGNISNMQSLGGSASQNLNFHNGQFRMFVGAPHRDVVVAETETQPGEWAHYTIMRDGNEMRLYINGELDATATTTWTGDYIYNAIGGAGPHGATLNGMIDEVGLYDSALSMSELSAVIDNGVNGTGVPTNTRVAFYDFENPADTPDLPAGAALTSTRIEENAPRVLDLQGASVAVDPVTLSGDFTVSAWVKLDDGISNADAILGHGTNAVNGQNLNFHNGHLRMFAGRNDGRDIVVADTEAEAGEWTFYSVVRSGNETSIYMDGVLDATGSGWTQDFVIDTLGNPFAPNGTEAQIDDVQIWTEARSESELAQDMAGDIGEDAALERRYEFDGEGNVVVDSQDNGAATTITAGATLVAGGPDLPEPPQPPEPPTTTSRALDLDGTSVAIEPLTLSGDFTVAAYVRLDAALSNADALVGSALYNLNFHSGLVRLHDRTEGRGSNGDVVIANTAMQSDVWTHVAVSRDGDATSLFVDGQLVGFETGWTGDFAIDQIGGGVNSLANGGTDGQIDDLKIWDVAKSEPELLQEIDGTATSDEGLIRSYSFDGDADVIVDLTGNSPDAPLTAGASFVERDDVVDPGGPSPTEATNALSLDNQRVNLAEDIVLSGDFTMQGWFYFDEDGTISNEDGVVSSADASINFFQEHLRIFLRDLGGDVLVANTAVEAGDWTHVSITREDGIARLYLNGNLDVSSTSNGFWAQSRTTWETDFVISDLFGGIPSAETGLDGQVDDFQIWDVARSQAEIVSDLSGDLEDTTGLLHRYTFSDDTGQIVDDAGNAAPVAAPSSAEFVPSTAPFALPVNVDDFTDTQVAAGFDLAVDLTFLPDGRMLVIEKGGVVYLIDDPTVTGSDTSILLDISEITLNDAERGLLAVEVDPNFEDNGYVYFYHTMFEDVNGTDRGKTTVSRFELVDLGEDSYIEPGSQTVLWQEWDYSRSTVHQGGGLAIAYEPIDDDDPSPYKIYITTSDDGSPAWTDDLNRDEGKVHRINLTDGSIPSDNPYYDAAAAADYTPWVDTSSAINDDNQMMTIHSYGLRNAWRASYDQESETLFIGEVGAGRGSFEDVHIADDFSMGETYGFPQTTGYLNDPDAPGNPFISYGRNVDGQTAGNASVTGGVVYRGDALPDEYQGAYFYGDWANNWIRYATVDYSGDRPEVIEDNFLKDTTGRVLAFEEGPDGALYYLTGFQTGAVFSFESVVNRLEFDSSNSAPVGDGIVLADDLLFSQTAPYTVQFSADVSDPDGDDLTYFWSFGAGFDLDGDGFGDTEVSSEAAPTYTYQELGQYRVDLVVTDSNGTSTVFAPEFITVGNAPTPVITGDVVDGGTWRAGESFTVSGLATDIEDGVLDSSQITISSAYAFDGLLRPGPFEEQVLTDAGVTFTTPTSGTVQSFLDSFTVFLTATDSDGLEATTQIEMVAEQVELIFDAPIEAEFFEFDEKAQSGDFAFDSTVGFNHVLFAPETYTDEGDTFVFREWSDGVTENDRIFVTPDEDTVITAIYDLA
ncbi:MAG: LamG-like jellyroll fold domain-containing protein [Pseudomonadota bacterium]